MSVLPHPLQWLALDCREVLQRNFHQNFTPGVAEQPMQDDQGQQRTLGEVWMDVWLREYDDWFASDNKYAVASQVTLAVLGDMPSSLFL